MAAWKFELTRLTLDAGSNVPDTETHIQELAYLEMGVAYRHCFVCKSHTAA